LAENVCADEVNFLGCEYIGFDMIQSDGIVGMLPEAHESESDLLVNKLYDAGQIDSR